jgi:hypothetical protein
MTADNGTVLDMEMIEGAWSYVEAVQKAAGSSQLHVEQKMSISYVHDECFGTPDCWFLLDGKRELHLFDYKYGYGIVDVFENWQLVCYTAGIVQQLGLTGLQDQELDVVMHVVQPRPFHVLGPHRTWRVKASDLRGYYNRLAHAANKALDVDPECIAGTPQCRYCNARHACAAAQKSAMYFVDYSSRAMPEELSPEALAIELRTLRRGAEAIKYRLTGVETRVESLIKAGGFIPGWALQQGQGRTAWTKPADEVFALGDMMGIDLRAEPAAITPAQAKKKGLPVELLSAYSAAGDSGVKLVPTEATVASRVFKS